MKSEDQSGLETKCLDSVSNLGATTTEKLEGTSGWVDTDPLPFLPRTLPISRHFATAVSSVPSPTHRCFLSPLNTAMMCSLNKLLVVPSEKLQLPICWK